MLLPCWPCRISGTDIKDKTELIEARKSVERQMERFKVLPHPLPLWGSPGHASSRAAFLLAFVTAGLLLLVLCAA